MAARRSSFIGKYTRKKFRDFSAAYFLDRLLRPFNRWLVRRDGSRTDLIVTRSAAILDARLDAGGAREIARRSRGTIRWSC